MHEQLTWRQADVLLSIYTRIEKFGYVTAGDLVSDSGVSIATVGNYLKSLHDKELIIQPDGKKVKNSNFNYRLELTPKGVKDAEYRMSLINASKTDSIKDIYDKNLNYCQKLSASKSSKWDCYKKIPVSFNKGFNEILGKDAIEPFTVSMAMYSELDGQLALLFQSDRERYISLSRTSLNMQIRNGRIASMAIPISLRGNISQRDLDEILGNSWNWPGITWHRSAERYLGEILSLGIAQKQGNIYTSLNPTTTDTITWLANKVNSAFQNAIGHTPKVTLVEYRESFKYPTPEDLLNPQNSEFNFDWLNKIHENMSNQAYKTSIDNGLDILLNQTGIIELYENRLIPRTVLRKIGSVPEMESKFRFLLQRASEGNVAATILLAITAKPGMTMTELHQEINKQIKDTKQEDIESTLNTLTKSGLIYPSHAKFTSSQIRYYAFTQIPYLINDSDESLKANAILKNVQPDILTKINDMFPILSEKKILYDILNEINQHKSIDLENIEENYGKPFARKMILLSSSSIYPFIKLDPTFSKFVLAGSGISGVILNVIQFSIKTNNESIGIYSPTLSEMLTKDKKYHQKVGSDASELKNEIFEIDLKKNKM